MKRFRDKDTEIIWEGVFVKRFPKEIQKLAYRKIQFLMAATSLAELRIPHGNRLKSLKGDRIGHHSIRVNDQYRLCFVWTKEGAMEIELTDYH